MEAYLQKIIKVIITWYGEKNQPKYDSLLEIEVGVIFIH